MTRRGQTTHIRGEGSGRNYSALSPSDVAYNSLEVPVATGEVALISWVRITPPGDSPPIQVTPLSGDAASYPWVEIDGAEAGTAVGQGWLKGNGVYLIELLCAGSLQVDVDPGFAVYNPGT